MAIFYQVALSSYSDILKVLDNSLSFSFLEQLEDKKELLYVSKAGRTYLWASSTWNLGSL